MLAWHGWSSGLKATAETNMTSLEATVRVWTELVEEEKSSAPERREQDARTAKAKIAGFMSAWFMACDWLSRGKTEEK